MRGGGKLPLFIMMIVCNPTYFFSILFEYFIKNLAFILTEMETNLKVEDGFFEEANFSRMNKKIKTSPFKNSRLWMTEYGVLELTVKLNMILQCALPVNF